MRHVPFFKFMPVNQRVQGYVILYGIVLGVMLALWFKVFHYLYLENASKEFLFFSIIYFIGFGVVLFVIFYHARRLARQEARP
jgi:uncharacterized Tic20 family protein